MKSLQQRCRLFQASILTLFVLLLTGPAFSQPALPPPPPLPGDALEFWRLESPPWEGTHKQPALAFTNVTTAPSWDFDGTSLSIGTNVPAYLNLAVFETNRTNITFDSGSLEIWCAPGWTSLADGGTGSGSWATVWDIGSYTRNASIGAWLLTIDPPGSNLVWVAQSGGSNQMLWTGIDFDAGDWHQLVATWSETNSCLYVDGELATNAGPILYQPSATECSNAGFCVGSLSASGTNAGAHQFQGQLQWLISYAYPLSADDVADDFADVSAYINYFGYNVPGGGIGVGGFHPADGAPDDWPPGDFGTNSGGTNDAGLYSGYYLPSYTITSNYLNYTNFWLSISNNSTNAFVSIQSTLSNLTYEILTNSSLAATNGWGVWQILTASNDITPAPPLALGSNVLFFKGMLASYPDTQPVFNPPPGVYAVIQQVTVTCDVPGITIHYTTDGTTPTAFSPVLPTNSVVGVPYSLTLQAAAFSDGLSGGISSGNYYLVGAISAGSDFALYLDPYGNAYAWGDNSIGQLGDGSTDNSSSPMEVLDLTNVIQIAASYYCSFASDQSGAILGWGEDGGFLGTGTTSISQDTVPVPVLLTNAAQIASGFYHSLALKPDGSVWSWGDNYFGELGNGGFDSDPTPTAVGGLGGISAIGAGFAHSLAISNGNVYGWGGNFNGQLGNDPNSYESNAILIAGISNAIGVQGAFGNSYALRADSTVWAWGNNADGELGIGTNEFGGSPVQVKGLSNVLSISASEYGNYCLALKSDGTVWAWGGNDGNGAGSCGQLGDGSCDSTNLPTMVIGLSNIVSISAGTLFAMALQNDGTVWAWGDNSIGELGNFGGSSTNAPVQILSPHYYSGQLPVLTITGGNNQAGNSNALLANPLQVRVADTNGSAFTNAPITFAVTEGDAQLLEVTSGTPTTSVSVLTDTNGIATIWAGLGTDETNTITAFAICGTNSVSVEFTEYIALAPPTISITGPTNGGTYLIVTNQTLTITVDADAVPGTSIEEVDYHYQTNSGGSNTLLGVSTESPYSFIWTNSLWWTNAFVGQYTLSAVAVDNQSIQSEPQSVTITIALDSDDIGIPDYWQLQYFGYVGVNPNSSPDGNGQSLLYDYQNDIDPTDYYDGSLPNLEILSGGGQAGDYDSFLPEPVIIEVTGANSAALTNAPVTFTVTNGTAILAVTTNDTPVTSLALRTDGSGQAAVWVYFPAATSNPPNSTIVVSASSETNSIDIIINEFVLLGHWTFNNTNTWIGDEGQLPLLATNVAGVPSWSSNAVLVDNSGPALLAYNVMETNGNTNINCQTGSVLFWFKPDWSSASVGGSGPGAWGRLLEMGSNGFSLSTNTWLVDSTNGWWALHLNPNGTQLLFGTSTNGGGMTNLSGSISWYSNEWYQIALTYSPSNSALYVDGQLLANGSGVTYFPNAGELTNGFRIGSDQNGSNQARGAFDELETFDFPMTATNAATYSGELPYWWLVKYFGSLYGAATTVDGQGQTLLSDYEQGWDPNLITFSISVTNIYVNTNQPMIPLDITWGVPFYMAVVTDTNPVSAYTNGPINFAAATWQPYPASVSLDSGDGSYSVWIGLKGNAPNADQTWQVQRVVLDTTPPVLTITNPAAVVSQSMVQVQGYANEALANLSFEVSNANGIWTNQRGYITAQFSNTNLLDITTNYFQCYDVVLTTNGVNLITLHATDLAGNMTTTNFSVTFDLSLDTNPPALTVIWPPDGTEISGSQFIFEGQIDNPTATVAASIVDSDGNTNTAQGVVERSGLVWVSNLPLGEGENTLTITATDAAGNNSTTNLTLYQSSVTVTMDPLATNMFNQSLVTVTGTVSDPDYTVTVNGVTAAVCTNGVWQATNVPVNPVGTAIFDVEATDGSDPSQVFNVSQTVNTVLSSYSINYAGYNPDAVANKRGDFGYTLHYVATAETNEGLFGPVCDLSCRALDWTYQSGGHDKGFNCFSGSMVSLESGGSPPSYSSLDTNLPPTNIGISAAWEFNPAEGIQTRVMIQPSGPAIPGAMVAYLVQAQAYYENGGAQVSPAMMQIGGVPLTPATNADGSVWGNALLQAPAGASPDVTPASPGSNTFNVTAAPLHIYFNGQDIANSNVTVLVGQQISLTCGFDTNKSQITNYQWMVPGNTIASFYVSPDTLKTNGYPIALTATNSSNVDFYWLDAGTNKLQCIVAGMATNTTTFTVQKPTAELSAEIENTVNILNNDELILGGGLPGIAFFENNESIDGDWELVQLGSQAYSYQEATNGQWYIGQGSGLDSAYPYPIVAETDSPSTGLLSSMSQATGTGSFTMYLTFMPSGTNSIRVPIRQMHWGWQGTATNSSGTWTSSGNATNDSHDAAAPSTISWTNNILSTINDVQPQ